MSTLLSQHAVSLMLLREANGEQRPIYFVSKAFTDCQTSYVLLKKLVLALVITIQKLMHYFQAHPIIVYTKGVFGNVFTFLFFVFV